MTRVDWWLGVLIVTLSILVHAVMPRYEWHSANTAALANTTWVRIDRWTGTLEVTTTPHHAVRPDNRR